MRTIDIQHDSWWSFMPNNQAARHQRRETLLPQFFHRWSMIAVIMRGAVP
nr:hypothetical protein [Nitrosomonas nitrosa]